MAIIEWSEPALTDVALIRDYLAAESPQYARRWVERIFEAAEPLTLFPQQGRKVPEAAPRTDIRELIVQGYRLIYWTNGQQVTMLAVVHGSRPLEQLAPLPWE